MDVDAEECVEEENQEGDGDEGVDLEPQLVDLVSKHHDTQHEEEHTKYDEDQDLREGAKPGNLDTTRLGGRVHEHSVRS